MCDVCTFVLIAAGRPSSPRPRSPAGTFGLVAQFGEQGDDGVTMVALDFDDVVFERAARAQPRFEQLEQRLFALAAGS